MGVTVKWIATSVGIFGFAILHLVLGANVGFQIRSMHTLLAGLAGLAGLGCLAELTVWLASLVGGLAELYGWLNYLAG